MNLRATEMDSANEKNVATDSELDPTTDEIDALTHGLASNGNIIDDGLQRGLKGRHLQMMALGGVVGYVLTEMQEHDVSLI
jgi:amino acid transporter